MFMIRKMQGNSMEEMLHPDFRTVNYKDAGAVMTVATRVRQAWVTDPAKLFDDKISADIRESFGKAARRIQDLSDDELRSARNHDQETVHTPLRDMVYGMWNHVWWDIAGFLQEAACDTGHAHLPSHEVIAVNHGEKLDKVFDTHTLIAAAYVKPGFVVRFHIGNQEIGEAPEALETAAFVFDATKSDDVYNVPEVHWIKKRTNVRARVEEGDRSEGNAAGTVAVFVLGALCDKTSEEESADQRVEDTT